MKSKWAKFYHSRVNSDRYLSHFKNTYSPFINAIIDEDPSEIIDMGCGIGMVSKVLHPKGIQCVLADNDRHMLRLACANNSSWATMFNTFKMDIINHPLSIESFTITHGVLEHFNNTEIFKAIDSMPYSLHYVPLEGHKIPSFGDERLMNYKFWINLLNPIKWGVFNDQKDMWFLIKK